MVSYIIKMLMFWCSAQLAAQRLTLNIGSSPNGTLSEALWSTFGHIPFRMLKKKCLFAATLNEALENALQKTIMHCLKFTHTASTNHETEKNNLETGNRKLARCCYISQWSVMSPKLLCFFPYISKCFQIKRYIQICMLKLQIKGIVLKLNEILPAFIISVS